MNGSDSTAKNHFVRFAEGAPSEQSSKITAEYLKRAINLKENI
ncbi:unnamed protein product [Brugia timori]|uniref:Uncharacterized protein n=1 Tax=Brugia timori TaxID=42155 RepID=A0A3P7U0G5_9BILA|nr:unnamed protein product [Brugia timori]